MYIHLINKVLLSLVIKQTIYIFYFFYIFISHMRANPIKNVKLVDLKIY